MSHTRGKQSHLSMHIKMYQTSQSMLLHFVIQKFLYPKDHDDLFICNRFRLQSFIIMLKLLFIFCVRLA